MYPSLRVYSYFPPREKKMKKNRVLLGRLNYLSIYSILLLPLLRTMFALLIYMTLFWWDRTCVHAHVLWTFHYTHRPIASICSSLTNWGEAVFPSCPSSSSLFSHLICVDSLSTAPFSYPTILQYYFAQTEWPNESEMLILGFVSRNELRFR